MLALALALLVAAQDPADVAPILVEPVPVVDPAAPAAAGEAPVAEGPIDPAGPLDPAAAAAAEAPPAPAPAPPVDVAPAPEALPTELHPDALLSAGIIAGSVVTGAFVGIGTAVALLRVRTFGFDTVGWATVLAVVPSSILIGGAAAVLLVPDPKGGALLAAAGLAAGLPVAALGFVIGDLVGSPVALFVYLLTGGVGPWFVVPLVAGPALGALAGGVAGGIGGALLAKRAWDAIEGVPATVDVEAE